MNFEQIQRLREARAEEEQKFLNKMNERAAKVKGDVRVWLEEHQIFKDLLPDPQHIEQYKRCRDFLILKHIANKVGRTVYNSADWAKGYMDGINSILDIVEDYNNKRNEFKI